MTVQRYRCQNGGTLQDRDVKSRQTFIDFGQTVKSNGGSNGGTGPMYDDERDTLLSRIAEKRPPVIGGRID